MKNLVLDSFAVLAYLQEEKGAAEVRSLFTKAKSGEVDLFLSAVNLGEIAYITEHPAGLIKAHSALPFYRNCLSISSTLTRKWLCGPPT